MHLAEICDGKPPLEPPGTRRKSLEEAKPCLHHLSRGQRAPETAVLEEFCQAVPRLSVLRESNMSDGCQNAGRRQEMDPTRASMAQKSDISRAAR